MPIVQLDKRFVGRRLSKDADAMDDRSRRHRVGNCFCRRLYDCRDMATPGLSKELAVGCRLEFRSDPPNCFWSVGTSIRDSEKHPAELGLPQPAPVTDRNSERLDRIGNTATSSSHHNQSGLQCR